MNWITRERVKVDRVYAYCREMVKRDKPHGAYAA
jgi:hypothetical protein